MKVLFLNTFDDAGGAGRGGYRHHKGLQSIGVDCTMLVKEKDTDDPSVLRHQYPMELLAPLLRRVFKRKYALSKIVGRLDDFPLRSYPDRLPVVWSVGLLPSSIGRSVAVHNPDLVHLHWIGRGFVPIRSLSDFRRPIVWQLADQWAFTGGCHYSQGCERYKDMCGACHALNSSREDDLSRRILKAKEKHWHNIDLTVVTQSRWMRDCARESRLFRNVSVEIIPGGIDLETYRPVEKKTARRELGLPQDKAIVLGGAEGGTKDTRKGFTYLAQALQMLARNGWKEKLALFVFGGEKSAPAPDVGAQAECLGFVSDETLIRLYSAADVYVTPATEEGFGQTVVEAAACGTPSAAFDLGGFRDTIVHQRTGYLAKPLSVEDLAEGIAWILRDDHRAPALGIEARIRAEKEYEIKSVCMRYADLYKDILARRT